LEGWQSGIYFADQSAKKSAQTVRDWITQTGGACAGTVHAWTPAGVAAVTPPTTTTAGGTAAPAACKATKAACQAFIAGANKALAKLQKQAKVATGKSKL